MRNGAVEHNDAAFSGHTFAVRWQEMLYAEASSTSNSVSLMSSC